MFHEQKRFENYNKLTLINNLNIHIIQKNLSKNNNSYIKLKLSI